jgi:hypothetical protein
MRKGVSKIVLSMQAATHGGEQDYSCVTAGGCHLGGEGNKGNTVVLCIFIMFKALERLHASDG